MFLEGQARPLSQEAGS